MKDSGKWAVVFTVLNIILITVCVVLLLNKDRKPPIISFSGNDLIYYSGIDNEKLLQGVGAVDAKDGDVTDRIVVEKIVQNKNENRAIVYYAVTDLDGNAAKASRVFEAVNEATGDAMKDIGMAGFDGDMDGSLPGEPETLEPADAQEEGAGGSRPAGRGRAKTTGRCEETAGGGSCCQGRKSENYLKEYYRKCDRRAASGMD